MPITLNQVERYLENKNVAVVGASRDAKAFSNVIIKELKAKGYVVYPVNPNADTIQEMKAYKSIKEVPKQATTASAAKRFSIAWARRKSHRFFERKSAVIGGKKDKLPSQRDTHFRGRHGHHPTIHGTLRRRSAALR